MRHCSSVPSVGRCNDPSVLRKVRSCRDNLRSYFVGSTSEGFWCWCGYTFDGSFGLWPLPVTFCAPTFRKLELFSYSGRKRRSRNVFCWVRLREPFCVTGLRYPFQLAHHSTVLSSPSEGKIFQNTVA
jgi:hypothetical protein